MSSLRSFWLADLRQAVHDRARVDARALAALRIALGTLLLVDLGLRARNLTVLYTDQGVFTRQVLAELYPLHRSISIHALSGDAWLQVLLFLIAGVAAVALAAGYRTRLATAVSLVLLLSLHARNPTVLNSGDVLLRRLLFFGLFVPLGARWSLDAVGTDERRSSVATLASLALLTQVVLVYLTNLYFKLDGSAWFEGEAVHAVLGLERFAVFLAPIVRDVDPIATGLAWIWLALLACSWLLLALTGRNRGLLAAAFVGMHAGMAATMDLGIFPFVSIAALLPFLPPTVWDRVERTRVAERTRRNVAQRSWGRAHSRFASLGDQLQPLRRSLHASLLVALLLATAMGTGLVPAPDGAPEEVSESSWTMFARPPTTDTWLVAAGEFESGRTVDLLHDGPPRYDRPPDVDRYPNARWRKHLSRYEPSSPLPAALADYQCRQWANRADDGLQTITMTRIWTPVDGSGDGHSSELGRFRCTADGAEPVPDDER